MKRIFIVLLFFVTALHAADNGQKKKSQEFLYGDTPTSILLYWSYGLNYEKYDQRRHILEHVYADHRYVSSDYVSRQEAIDRCEKGLCGFTKNEKFKMYPRHLSRQNLDRLRSYANFQETLLCIMCTPNDGGRDDI